MSTNNKPNKEEQKKLIVQYVISLLDTNPLSLSEIGVRCSKKFDWFLEKNVSLKDALSSESRFTFSNPKGTLIICSMKPSPKEPEKPPQTTSSSSLIGTNTPSLSPSENCVLVDSKATLSQAELDLKNAKVIAADCEGVSLGKDGKLCLVQIAVGSNQYLFDVLVGNLELRKSILDTIKQYFESPSVLKIFHDCRQDSSALYHQHGIRLKNVVDCQVAQNFIEKNRSRISFNDLCSKYDVPINPFKDQVHNEMKKNNSTWAVRPLKSVLINYAAADVKYLEKLYMCMRARINASIEEDIKKASEEYVNFYLGTVPINVLKEAEVESLNNEFKIVNQLYVMLDLFPADVQTKIGEHCGTDRVLDLIEIVMDKGRQYELFFYGDNKGHPIKDSLVEQEHLDHVVGQLQFASDKRAGIEGSLHRISAIHNRQGNIVGLTLRIGRSVIGLASVISDLVENGGSILLLGHPGSGKTTIIRDMARIIAETRRVIIVDTSCEIGGFGDVPHVAVGRARRMQVADIRNQQDVMIQAVQNHTPEVIVIDEIGTHQEVLTARTISQRGVTLCASAHGSMQSIMRNPVLNELLGGVENVIVSDRMAEQTQGEKMRLQMKNPPIFDTVIELLDSKNNEWNIYRNVKDTVMKILAGQKYEREVRSFNLENNTITKQVEYVDPLIAPGNSKLYQ